MNRMKELYEKVSRYSPMQEKLARIIRDAERAGLEETKKKLAAFAQEHGYDVTIKEMQEYFREIAEERASELSDAELDIVAGGKRSPGADFLIAGFDSGYVLTSVAEEALYGEGYCSKY